MPMKKLTLGLSLAALAMAGAAGAAQTRQTMRDGDWNKTVTRAEAQAKAGEMFDKMDLNHDGKLDAADRQAHQDMKFSHLDTNKDGAISREEFDAAHKRPGMDGDHKGAGPMAGHEGMGDGQGKHRMGGRHPGMGMMMLHKADANKDGAVSKAEFTAQAMKHFDMADADKDGKVTPAERKAAHEMMKQRMGEHMKHRMGNPDTPPPPAK